jgi:putative FmdB family regulatory protein
MPSYDYRCRECGKRSVIFQTYEEYGRNSIACPHCGSEQLQRVIGRVRIAKSEASRLEDLSDPGSWGDFDEDDPSSMGRMMRKMSNELGEDMPPEFDEVVDRLEAGESPEQIEKDMPDLDGDGGELNF